MDALDFIRQPRASALSCYILKTHHNTYAEYDRDLGLVHTDDPTDSALLFILEEIACGFVMPATELKSHRLSSSQFVFPFFVEHLSDQKIALREPETSRYLSARQAPDGRLIIHDTYICIWETFEIIALGSEIIGRHPAQSWLTQHFRPMLAA